MSASARSRRPLALVAVASLLLAACSGEQAPMQMPTPEVTVVTLKAQPVPLTRDLAGRTVPFVVAEVRPQAPGIVEKRLFEEGSLVKAGEVLYQLDDASYRAARDAAAANLARAKASATSARLAAERSTELVAAKLVSQQDHERTMAAAAEAAADVAAYRAALQAADVNLGYTRITAPISGRAGKQQVTEGALVGQGDVTLLTTVDQIDPLYVNFTQSANDILQLRKAMANGQFKRADGKEAASVRLILSDGTEYAQAGKLLFSDLSVDASTGQVTLRAEVPNPKGELLPGLYLRVRLEQAQASNAITLPQQAVTRTQQGDTVSVVGDDGKISQRTVKISAAQNNRWVVREGLQAGEKVMVDGFQKLQMLPPGTPVKAVPWQAPGQAATPAPAPAADASAAKP